MFDAPQAVEILPGRLRPHGSAAIAGLTTYVARPVALLMPIHRKESVHDLYHYMLWLEETEPSPHSPNAMNPTSLILNNLFPGAPVPVKSGPKSSDIR